MSFTEIARFNVCTKSEGSWNNFICVICCTTVILFIGTKFFCLDIQHTLCHMEESQWQTCRKNLNRLHCNVMSNAIFTCRWFIGKWHCITVSYFISLQSLILLISIMFYLAANLTCSQALFNHRAINRLFLIA